RHELDRRRPRLRDEARPRRPATSTSAATSAATSATSATATTSAATAAATAATAATAASRCPVRGAEGARPDASQGPHADPRETLLCRSHPQCSLEASGPRDRREPEA